MSVDTSDSSGDLGIQHLRTIDLATLGSQADLQRRYDTKCLVQTQKLSGLFSGLDDGWRILEIDGARSFPYITHYYDDEVLTSFHDHVKGRRYRFKVRTRRYQPSGGAYLEVKLKTYRGATDKRRILRAPGAMQDFDATEGEWLDSVLALVRPGVRCADLRPSIELTYRRMTLVHGPTGERVTVDLNCTAARGDQREVLLEGTAIIEVKSSTVRGKTADLLLREWGVRPIDFSKYCGGLSALDPTLDRRMLNQARRIAGRETGNRSR